VRGGGTLRVSLHGDAHPARRLDGRSGPSDRDLLSAVRATLAGLCASLVGIGLARFAYTPLLPALIGGGWFAPSAAAYLGAANLAGYLAGALLARWWAARVDAVLLLRAMMALATAAFCACASPLSFAWYLVWRLAAGVAGGVLMVLAAPTVSPRSPLIHSGRLLAAPMQLSARTSER
jgi:MFS family permease